MDEKIELETIECIPIKGTDFMGCSIHGRKNNKYIDENLREEIFSVESNVPVSALLGEQGSLLVKPSPIGEQLRVKKIKRTGYPEGFDLIITK